MEVIGFGQVRGDYRFEEGAEYPHVRGVDWQWRGHKHFENMSIKTLTEVTKSKDVVHRLMELVKDEVSETTILEQETSDEFVGYDIDQALDDVFLDRACFKT